MDGLIDILFPFAEFILRCWFWLHGGVARGGGGELVVGGDLVELNLAYS